MFREIQCDSDRPVHVKYVQINLGLTCDTKLTNTQLSLPHYINIKIRKFRKKLRKTVEQKIWEREKAIKVSPV